MPVTQYIDGGPAPLPKSRSSTTHHARPLAQSKGFIPPRPIGSASSITHLPINLPHTPVQVGEEFAESGQQVGQRPPSSACSAHTAVNSPPSARPGQVSVYSISGKVGVSMTGAQSPSGEVGGGGGWSNKPRTNERAVGLQTPKTYSGRRSRRNSAQSDDDRRASGSDIGSRNGGGIGGDGRKKGDGDGVGGRSNGTGEKPVNGSVKGHGGAVEQDEESELSSIDAESSSFARRARAPSSGGRSSPTRPSANGRSQIGSSERSAVDRSSTEKKKFARHSNSPTKPQRSGALVPGIDREITMPMPSRVLVVDGGGDGYGLQYGQRQQYEEGAEGSEFGSWSPAPDAGSRSGVGLAWASEGRGMSRSESGMTGMTGHSAPMDIDDEEDEEGKAGDDALEQDDDGDDEDEGEDEGSSRDSDDGGVQLDDVSEPNGRSAGRHQVPMSEDGDFGDRQSGGVREEGGEGEDEDWDSESAASEKATPVIHVEIRRRERSDRTRFLESRRVIERISYLIKTLEESRSLARRGISATSSARHCSGLVRAGTYLDLNVGDDERFDENIHSALIAEIEPPADSIDLSNDYQIVYHVYTPTSQLETKLLVSADEDDSEGMVSGAMTRSLPCAEFEGIWENLIYADDLKPRLLRYITSSIAFSQKMVDPNQVSWNRLVLLHGPPGTGKTSLCRSISQKLLIRMSNEYPKGHLVEINSHSLFSKWFSESGKLVQSLFNQVHEMVNDPKCFVIVMIDEVESLTAARSEAAGGTEPSDAVRVVNALLTQLDKLKSKQNVLVMTTSNIPDQIDAAFIDRADEKFFVDFPPPEAIYWIITGSLRELVNKMLVKRCYIPDLSELEDASAGDAGGSMLSSRARNVGERIRRLANECRANRFAGRFLRRLPVLAHARYLASSTIIEDMPRSVERWVEAMEKVVRDEVEDRGRVSKKIKMTMGESQREGE